MICDRYEATNGAGVCVRCGFMDNQHKPGLTLSCTEGCVLPDDERLYEIGGEQFHSVFVRAGNNPGHYYGQTPDEYEPCGPVTATRLHSTRDR